jgi:PAS domain-containing protein
MEKARILIVEDKVIIATELKYNLQNLGYELTSIVDSGEDAIRITESEGIYIYLNQQYKNTLGFAPEELMGRRLEN